MISPIFKNSLLFVFLIFLSFQGSISLKTKNENQNQQIMNAQDISKSLKMLPDYGKIPLYFIPNEGQVDERAIFYAKASRYTLWLTKEGLVFDGTRRLRQESTKAMKPNPRDINNPEDFKYDRDVSRVVFINANRSSEVVSVDRTEHKVNYFIGNDKSNWRTNIQTSKAVLYKELYRNIDLKVYGIEKQIEYDFIVKPGGEVTDINFEYKDVKETNMDSEGNLVVETEFGEFKHARPVCYQIIRGERVEVGAKFKKIENNTYGFIVREYNKNYELIIDPLVLVYSTYLGSFDFDYGRGIAVDSDGAAYITGYTSSTGFPAQNPFKGNIAGDYDAFITKINSSGDALVYSTFLGGDWCDEGSGIAVDSEGAVYVTGSTDSYDFPTQNPFQATLSWAYDAFITKISSSGDALIYSSFLGGIEYDYGNGIAVDSEGAAYVTGSADYDDVCCMDAFITKINSSGTTLVYSIYLGGSFDDHGNDIAVDSEGAAYVTGSTDSDDFPTLNPFQGNIAGDVDAFIAKINSSGTLIFSTYLGGSDSDSGRSIAVDSEGAAYVTGSTSSTDFSTQNPIQGNHAGFYDAFISKINSTGTALVYSTYLGGSGNEGGGGIAVDSEGAAYITGSTSSTDFSTQNPIQGNHAGFRDAFISKINSTGTALVCSTYLGGSGNEGGGGIAVDSEGAAYVIGHTMSYDFPTQNPIQGTHAGDFDAFITKLCFAYSLTMNAGSGGTTDPSPGTYTYCSGKEVIIEAIPDAFYRFAGWSDDVIDTDNPITITMNSDISITANFIRIIYPPSNFTGQKVLNRSLSQAEYINVLTWQANPHNENIVKYRIYQEGGESKSLLAELDASNSKYWHRRVEKGKPYIYAICAVNDENREGDPAHITVQ